MTRDQGLFVSEDGNSVLLFTSQSALYLQNTNGIISVQCGQEMIVNPVNPTNPVTTPSKSQSPGIIVAIVVPIVVFVIGIIVLFLILMFYRRKSKKPSELVFNAQISRPSIYLKTEGIKIDEVIGKGQK